MMGGYWEPNVGRKEPFVRESIYSDAKYMPILPVFAGMMRLSVPCTVRPPQFTIQGVSRLEDITAAGNIIGLSDQKSSYKRVSDFGRLRNYGHF